ncbi:BTAD domain-containing putative transcriptional regulator [Dactylosporangium fulvum]|uniref:Winged helix-turn-helix domain-containing protein n=1 Tax=Dactylosporangium fulvum TaxID=53359 RepID=A0ABY5VXR8_9ACTN|nr:BTAD domain-containing putative transcriptional regulator [Dactylosporangium fulvum]UWP82420.1 winged helix-turn-helix domain-containing protein [Dactylosporangium fulvum]
MRFGVLGPLTVWADDGRTVSVPGAKVRALLAALLVRAGQPVTTDRLVDELWGDNPPGNPAAALAVKVSQLRKALDDTEPGSRALIGSGPAGFTLHARSVDAVEFAALLTRAADEPRADARAVLLNDALALWRGPAYADHHDETFAEVAVARLEEQRLTAIDDRAEAYLALGRHAAVADSLADVVTENPLRERTRGLRMLALYRSGRQTEALEAYAELRSHLVEDLGVEPGPEIAALHQAVLAQDPALDAPPTALPAPQPTSNLPAPVTELFGRDEAIIEVTDLVHANRLVALTGPGGVGKTRLALEAARHAQPAFPDGAWLVELAAVDEGEDAVVDTVITTLGLRDTAAGATPPVDRLAAALRPRRMLLLLDNCEHLITDAAAVATRLLHAAPDLVVLATSREPLNVPGEVVWPVPPLDLPEATDDPGGSSAVQLFVARAAAANRGFVLDPSNSGLIAALCRRLDGLPLALELAATRVRGLGIQRLVAGLDDRFRLLAPGHRGGQPRHQTLTATIDWSWRLLTAPERIVLRRLAVHADGCTLEAAEAICAAGDIGPHDVPDLLARLVDRSLVARVERNTYAPRYRLLESVAAYCLDRLRETDDLGPTRQHHLHYYIALAEKAEPLVRGPDQAHWLHILDAEAANLRTALDFAIRERAGEAVLRLVNALAWYWFLRGRLGEAHRAMRTALAAVTEPSSVSARATATAWEAGFAFLLGDVSDWPARHEAALREFDDAADDDAYARAAWFLAYAEIDLGDVTATETLLNDTLSRFDKTDDMWGTAATLTLLAKLAYIRGDAETVARDGTRAAALFRRLGDRWGMIQATGWLGAHAALGGEYDTAVALHTEGLGIARELGLWADVAGHLGWLGWIAMERGNYPEARLYNSQALALAEQQGAPLLATFATMGLAWTARRTGDYDSATRHLRSLLDAAVDRDTEAGQPLYVPSVLVELGHIAERRGDLTTAAEHHREALRVARKLGGARDISAALAGLASTAVAGGDHHTAATLLGGAAAAREPAGKPAAATERDDLERTTTAARSALGKDFDADFERGLHLALDDLPTGTDETKRALS